MKKFEHIGIGISEILLPKANVDHNKWAVVACDQYTSELEYWQQVSDLVGEAPSTFNMIYPEVYLNEKDPEKRIQNIRSAMRNYLENGVFESFNGAIYVERLAAGKTRKGLVLCVDLEKYDYSKGSQSLIRATEGTIVERIPPRVKIRKGAPLESPHIMVLIDDPQDTLFSSLEANRAKMEKAYDFKLMMNSGHLTGYKVDEDILNTVVVDNLEQLADPSSFTAKYDLPDETPILLYAMGDGNHSLATAKAIWEQTKEEANDVSSVMDSPTRFALVELVNVHDKSLVFEPIHRVLFELDADRDLLDEMKNYYEGRYSYQTVDTKEAMTRAVDAQDGSGQTIGVIKPGEFGLITVKNPDSNLPVGTLQNFLDGFIKDNGAKEIDYVHGTDTVINLGVKRGNIGFYLPSMDKNDLFKTVILDGALPRKTFSMGEAEEKRFYMECRRIENN